jgi:transaldolase
MKIFLDTADIDELKAAVDTGLIDGVTTNPSLVAKSGRPFREALKEICALVDGPISAEVVAVEVAGMLTEGRSLAEVAPNVTVKLPLTIDGLKACRTLTGEGLSVNVTLCFSAPQALLAAKAGATFVSPFIGRLDDLGVDGMALIHEIRAIYDNYGYATDVLAASIRTPGHVRDAAIAGADCATIPPKVFWSLYENKLTEQGLAAFLSDWKKSGQKV